MKLKTQQVAQPQSKRNRVQYFLMVIAVIGLGLLSRTSVIPSIIYPYLGDALYALMIYFIIGFCFPNKKSISIMLICIGICFLIEISQLYKADWIMLVRSYKIGSLILGHGFLWSDLICYSFGGLVGYVIEKTTLNKITVQLR
ncbi:DUF2809 domain-containing protein [Limibacter armeniacum]|uniref:ribosomal maturation YjgA family protein n=1 Tax=Limibacter armeniacum TaxID=466084 RepID=UPI002FE6ACFC